LLPTLLAKRPQTYLDFMTEAQCPPQSVANSYAWAAWLPKFLRGRLRGGVDVRKHWASLWNNLPILADSDEKNKPESLRQLQTALEQCETSSGDTSPSSGDSAVTCDRPNALLKDAGKRCLMAVPKKGRVHDHAMKLVGGIGLDHHRPERVDVAECIDFPLTLVFLPSADIPKFVGKGYVDVGITGIDVIEEDGIEVQIKLELGFGKCKLCVLAPVEAKITDVSTLAGGRIFTSFPSLAAKFFSQHDTQKNVKTQIKYVSGSVEAACNLGLADAVVDLVETGTTMRAAGLEIVATIMETQSVFISSPQTKHSENVSVLTKRIEGYLTSQKHQMIQYNVERLKLQSALEISPGKRSPTIASLDDPNWVSVSSLILKKEASTIMDKLQQAGATDILLFALTNTRM